MGTGRKAAAEPPWSGLSVLVPTKGEGDGDESWKPRCTNPSPPLWALEVTTPTVKFFTQKVREIPGNDKGPGGGETPQALYWSKTRASFRTSKLQHAATTNDSNSKKEISARVLFRTTHLLTDHHRCNQTMHRETHTVTT